MRFLALSFMLLCCTTVFGQKQGPVKTIERIFRQYIKYDESTDTRANKDAMTKAMGALKNSVKEQDLPLLIDVWMYYDPTDFTTRTLVEPIFFRHKKAALAAINKRIKTKKNWESSDTAPFSELEELKARLLSQRPSR